MERGTQRDLCLLVQPPNGWCWACPGARNFFQVSHMGAVVQILGLSLLLFQATRRQLDQKFTSWDLNRCPPGMLIHCRHELCLLRRSARPPILLTWKAKSKRVAIHWFAPQMPSTGRLDEAEDRSLKTQSWCALCMTGPSARACLLLLPGPVSKQPGFKQGLVWDGDIAFCSLTCCSHNANLYRQI